MAAQSSPWALAFQCKGLMLGVDMRPRAIDRLRTARGFTLTEMMVVVGIIAALAAFAIPNYLDWQRKYRLKDSIASLQSSLALARMIAMNHSTTVTVTLSQPAATSADAAAFTQSGRVRLMPQLSPQPVPVVYQFDAAGHSL